MSDTQKFSMFEHPLLRVTLSVVLRVKNKLLQLW